MIARFVMGPNDTLIAMLTVCLAVVFLIALL